ncbi:hypothetical protein NN561_016626 [Cricetulus griseus]
MSGRSALRGVGVAPEFKRTAAVVGEVTACFEPSRLGLSVAGSGLYARPVEEPGWPGGRCCAWSAAAQLNGRRRTVLRR